MDDKKFDFVAHIRGVMGLAVGAVAGYYAFLWLVSQGFYALAIPGAMMGIACGYSSRIYSRVLAVACGASAASLLVFAEWKAFPFVADDSFVYFVAHLYQLKGVTLIMLVLGIVFAAWFGLGRPKSPR